MREIRLLNDNDWHAAVAINLNAYPGIKISPERMRERFLKMNRDPIISFYGLFEEDVLRGVMRLYDFSMKLLSTQTLVGGLGGVAVDIYHKKEKIAFDMVQFFLQHYQEKGACLTALYPFRPDFYKQMGFGYGRKMNQYRVNPADLPKGVTKANVSPLANAEAHRNAFMACYERFAAKNNGLIAPHEYWVDSQFSSKGVQIAACWHGDAIRGYVVFGFEPVKDSNFIRNELHVRSLVYETTEALSELLTFLHSQADQIETIVFNTQAEDFHYLLRDPRNGTQNLLPPVFHESNVQGVGIMYRVIDVPRLFSVLREHNFGGQSFRLKLIIEDSFFAENGGEWVLVVADGRVQLAAASADYDVELALGIAEFSSLMTGAVEFKTINRYGLARLSDPRYEAVLQRLFFTENKPICMTGF